MLKEKTFDQLNQLDQQEYREYCLNKLKTEGRPLPEYLDEDEEGLK